MAEFGPQATELSAPQGAGSSPVRPVTTGLDLSGLSQVMKSVEEMGELQQRQEAASVVQKYVDNRSKFTQAAESGKDLPKINAMRRVDANKFRQMYPQYIKEFDKIDESYTTNTALGDAAEEAKALRESRSAAIKKAGEIYPINPNTSQESVDAYISTVQAAERFTKNLSAKSASLEFQQKSLNFNEDQKRVMMKDYARTQLVELGSTHLAAIQQTVNDISAQLDTNPGSYEQSMIQLQGTVSSILSSAAPFKESLPEVYDAYAKTLGDVVSSAKEFLDPTKKSENTLKNLNNRLATILAQNQVSLLQKDTRMGVLAGAAKLFDPTILTKLNTDSVLNDVVVPLLKKPEDFVVGTGTNPVIADKATQEKSYKTIEEMLSNSLLSTDPEAKEQGSNVLNNTLKQIAILDSQENVKPADIARVVSFFSSPTFGKAVRELKADPQLLNKALKSMDRYFSSQVIPQINKTLNETVSVVDKVGTPITVKTGRELATTRPTTYKNIPLTDVFNIVPSVNGISVEMKPGKQVSSAVVDDKVSSMVRAVNTTLQMEANLTNQSVDKIWEQKKGVFFPSLFPQEGVKESTTSGITAVDEVEKLLNSSEKLSDEQKQLLSKVLKQLKE